MFGQDDLLRSETLAARSGRVLGQYDMVPRPICVENLDRDFPALGRRAGVEPFDKSLHTLRESCIDDWAKQGYPSSVVQAWAGHRDIKTTMRFHSKVEELDVRRAASRRLFGRDDAISDATG